MINSIQQFLDSGVPNLQKATIDYSKDPTDFAGFVYRVRDEALKFALDYIAETLNTCNQMIKECPRRLEEWSVVRTDDKTLITSIGAVSFKKTLFKNKITGKTRYLLDDLLDFEPHERISEDAYAQLLRECVQSSYRKGGEAVSILDKVSKQTVKEKIHSLEFQKEKDHRGRKRKVEYLYIEADEDHVSLQFQKKKGDLEVIENDRKLNGMINKLVYVHEGITKEAPKSKRHKLINPHYFAGAYEGKANSELWDEVYEYIESTYDIDSVRRIYLSADGGAWIKSGRKRISGLIYALDGYHLEQCLFKMTSHMLDNAGEAREMLRYTICEGNKEDFISVVDMLLNYADGKKEEERILKNRDFLLDNWSASRVRLSETSAVGSSTEGHVYHVLSSRMSTLAMGWSRNGADKMARLRAYYYNGNDMLELVRYQKQVLKKAAGAEETEGLISEVRKTYHKYPAWGKYEEVMRVELSAEMKKRMSIGLHSFIWKLF